MGFDNKDKKLPVRNTVEIVSNAVEAGKNKSFDKIKIKKLTIEEIDEIRIDSYEFTF